MATDQKERPGRPFGVTLAVALTILMYTIFPLVAIGGVLIIENFFANVPSDTSPFGTPMVSGGDFRGGITNTQLFLQAAVAIGFLVIAIITWRGKRSYMRYIFMIVVLGLAIFAVIPAILPAQETANVGISGGSMDGVSNTLETLGIIAQGMITPLYVIWYMNRGPARAFFRGSYLNEDEKGVYAGNKPQPTKTNPSTEVNSS